MKIAIVNDMLIAVEAQRRTLKQRPQHDIIWIARDGKQAIELCQSNKPDLILMDIVMPVIDGVTATRHIMQHSPCAILIVTTDIGVQASRVFDAMAAGALDAIDTPSISSRETWQRADAFLAKIDAIEELVHQHAMAAPTAPPSPAANLQSCEARCTTSHIVVIGASAGGPAALAAILSKLPANFPAALIVVQHLDAKFSLAMADWLSAQTALPVRLARETDTPQTGTVLLAGGNDHLCFTSRNRLSYTREPLDYPYRPSIDVLFHSAAKYWRKNATGILLTGMGRDGALGLKAMRDQGCYTIAQDQFSSAVYGMPKAAATLEAAVDVLSLSTIAPKLLHHLAHPTAFTELSDTSIASTTQQNAITNIIDATNTLPQKRRYLSSRNIK